MIGVVDNTERNRKILQMYQEGCRKTYIANDLGLTRHVVIGVTLRARRVGNLEDVEYRFNDNTERNDKILRMFRAGFQQADIARDLGLTRNIVIGVIDRAREFGKLEDVEHRFKKSDTFWDRMNVLHRNMNKILGLDFVAGNKFITP